MQNKRLVLFFFLIIVVVLSGCISTKKLTDVFAPAPTTNPVQGVAHTMNEISDISNAEVKKAVYADYLSVGPGPTLVSGKELWEKSPTLIPLVESINNCNLMCSTLSMDCSGVFYASEEGGMFGDLENSWNTGGVGFCDDSISDSFKLPICNCLNKPVVGVGTGVYDAVGDVLSNDDYTNKNPSRNPSLAKDIDGSECTLDSECLSGDCSGIDGICISDNYWVGDCGSTNPNSPSGSWGCSSDKTLCKKWNGQEKKCATGYSCKQNSAGTSVGCKE